MVQWSQNAKDLGQLFNMWGLYGARGRKGGMVKQGIGIIRDIWHVAEIGPASRNTGPV